MVIDPESYYLENLKGKTAVQIMTKIRGLKREIARLKRVLEHPNYECKKKPSELTQLNCTQQYFLWRCIKKEAHKIMPYNVVRKKVILNIENRTCMSLKHTGPVAFAFQQC